MDKPVVWLPAYPCPPVPFDVKTRIKELRCHLDPKHAYYEDPLQHQNIEAVIRLYEEGKINGVDTVYVQRGKIISWEDILKDPGPVWLEEISYQRVQNCVYDHGPFEHGSHGIRMHLRLIPELGGDGTFCGIIALNDTGSNVLTIFTTDFPHLGNTQRYNGGLLGHGRIRDANDAAIVLPRILVQVQLVENNGVPWTGWIVERAVVRTPDPFVPRLSG